VGDIAEPLGKQLNGWTNIAKDICIVNKVWKAVPWGIIPIAVVYRTDWAKDVGYDKFPDTYDEMLVLCRKMKEKGHNSGFALGRAIGDANQSHYPMLWAHGGAECKADGKTVAINSPGTAKAVDYVRQLFKEGESEDVFSWDDSSNNRAFLAGELACTGNAASIYWAEQKNAPQLREVTNHALWPKGPAGRFGYSTSMGLGIYRFSKFQKECKAFLTWLMQPTQYSAWIGVGEGQIAGLAAFYENDPVWKKDPKLEVIREIPKYVRMPGYPGAPTRHAAESMVKYVIVNMFARACKGTSTPETIKQAEAELKEIYAKS
jgi:multiple sugar transport system substrate-binding protein